MREADGLERGERATVIRDGEEIVVFDHISVSTNHYVNSVNGFETFEPDIAKGDTGAGPPPEAVTERVANLLQDEWGIDVEELGIETINTSNEDVQVL